MTRCPSCSSRPASLGITFAAALMLYAGPIFAQTVMDRAGELKTWREQCSDPDRDLRAAFVEAALKSGDTGVARICIRQSLASTNADIRNLGLRAAIAAASRLVFSVTPPDSLQTAIAAVDGDLRKLKGPIGHVNRHWLLLKNGLPIEVRGEGVASSTSVWYPLVNLTKRSDHYSGTATITGDAVTWVGATALSTPNACTMKLRLTEDSKLAGTLQCRDLAPFGVSADLL